MEQKILKEVNGQFLQIITDIFERFFAVCEIDERLEDPGIISSEIPPASQLKSIEKPPRNLYR